MTTPAEKMASVPSDQVPDAWKKALEQPVPDITIPARDSNDPALLAAWYDAFGAAEHYRKVRLAHCREIVRAKAALNGEKLTVDRTDDLGRLHPAYLLFLEENLRGRTLWEQEKLKQGRGG